jgi:hypothetical protein
MNSKMVVLVWENPTYSANRFKPNFAGFSTQYSTPLATSDGLISNTGLNHARDSDTTQGHTQDRFGLPDADHVASELYTKATVDKEHAPSENTVTVRNTAYTAKRPRTMVGDTGIADGYDACTQNAVFLSTKKYDYKTGIPDSTTNDKGDIQVVQGENEELEHETESEAYKDEPLVICHSGTNWEDGDIVKIYPHEAHKAGCFSGNYAPCWLEYEVTDAGEEDEKRWWKINDPGNGFSLNQEYSTKGSKAGEYVVVPGLGNNADSGGTIRSGIFFRINKLNGAHDTDGPDVAAKVSGATSLTRKDPNDKYGDLGRIVNMAGFISMLSTAPRQDWKGNDDTGAKGVWDHGRNFAYDCQNTHLSSTGDLTSKMGLVIPEEMNYPSLVEVDVPSMKGAEVRLVKIETICSKSHHNLEETCLDLTALLEQDGAISHSAHGDQAGPYLTLYSDGTTRREEHFFNVNVGRVRDSNAKIGVKAVRFFPRLGMCAYGFQSGNDVQHSAQGVEGALPRGYDRLNPDQSGVGHTNGHLLRVIITLETTA